MPNSIENAETQTNGAPAEQAAQPPSVQIIDDVCVIVSGDAAGTIMAPVVVEKPAAGETYALAVESGKKYFFNFEESDVKAFTQKDGDLTVEFKDGSSIVLENYAQASSSDAPADFAFSDEFSRDLIKVVDTTPGQENLLEPKTEKRAEASDDAKKMAQVEPAAGDEAQKLAQIEPAAGEDGGGDGRGGFGFGSSFDAQGVIGLEDVGPIGPTALQYGVQFKNDILFLQDPQDPNDVPDISDTPGIGSGIENVDETDVLPETVSGTVGIDFGDDGAGSFGANGVFSSSYALVSHGEPVTVTQTATGYIGTTASGTVFEITIGANGDYSFTQFAPLDHADATDPDDVVSLSFGIQIFDVDGDTDTGNIVINIFDDGPSITADGTKTIDEDALGPVSVGGNLAEDFGEDGPGDIHPNGDFTATGDLVGPNLTSGGDTVVVTQTADGYVGTINGGATTVFEITINAATGAYEFTLHQPLDHAPGGDTITLIFGAEIVDYDGDTADTSIVIDITDDVPEIRDDNPKVGKGLENVDETNVLPETVNGTLPVDFGSDTPGTLTPDGAFSTTVPLVSHGNVVTVTQTANGYVGTINGGATTVFQITVQNNGDYSFTQFEPLDHPDASNANDVISLTFGVQVTDFDGDSDNGNIIVNIFDDGPQLSGDGTKTIFEKDIGPVAVNGDLVESYGEDGPGDIHTNGNFSATGDINGGVLTSNGAAITVTNTATGYVGTTNGGATTVFEVTINPATGAYTFTLHQPLDHSAGGNQITLNFGAEIVDYDGDTDDATISIKIKDDVPNIDDTPGVGSGIGNVDETDVLPETVGGTVNIDFGGDGPGAFGANGAFNASAPLTSHGNAVTVTQTATGYAGTINGGATTVFQITIDGNGDYSFTQFEPLDHPNPNNPNDSIVLNFGISISDADGDTDTGNIRINVFDDGPVAVNDGAFTDGNVLNGNVLANDDHGEDGPGAVISVQFGGTTYNVPDGGTINVNGNFGVLQISSNGNYTYTPNGGTDGTDEFRYTMDDYDDDKASAKLTIQVDNDDCPILIKPAKEIVDETFLGPIVETGVVQGNFFGDGPGTFSMDGNFSSGGSKLGGNLTSLGQPVTVSHTATGYVGTAGGNEVFTITINPATGAYEFTLKGVLDHADGSNPNDVITLNFGVRGTDTDGDYDSTVIRVDVLDDAPVAHDDHNTQTGIATGNVVTGLNGGPGAADDLSNDRNNSNSNTVTKISFGGTTVDVPAVGDATINGNFGVLKINSSGAYTYTPNAGGTGVGATAETLVLADAASGVEIEIDAIQTATGVEFTIQLVNGIADLNGFYLDLQGNGGPIISLGGGNNMSGTAGFDYGVVIGTTGGGDADVTFATVTINGLTIGDLEDAKIGIRATSVGDCREDSLKLVGEIEVDTRYCGCGEDQFVYTLLDRDGDTSTAKLTLECTPDTNVGITVNNGTDKICIKEDGEGTVPVVANYTGGDGDEVLTLQVSGIQPGWTVTAAGWTNNGGGVYSLTLPAGQNSYIGNFTFKPPANSDIDMKDLVFTATVADPDTGGSKTATDNFTVQVDAVVDAPTLNVSNVSQQNWYYKNTGYQVPLNVSSGVGDKDGSEVITKILIDLKQPLSNPVHPFYTLDDMGIGLNKGTEVSPGIWEITVNSGDAAAALNGLKLVVPNNMDYTKIHNSKIGGNESVNIIVKSFVKETVAPNDPNNGECDFSDNETCIIRSICLTFRITPLVLDLNGNGFEVVSIDAGVMFDMNNNGTLDKTSWVSGNDGMLAIDLNGDGVINNQSELFGNTDTLDNGFAKLAQYDSNGDGRIDSADTAFAELRVWTDVNQDGVSQADELYSLADMDIASINVNASETDIEIGDSYISHVSTYTKADGTVHDIADVSFNVIEGDMINEGVTLEGTAGRDIIYGTANDDVLIGGGADDILFGGEGNDIFVLQQDGGVDTIADFAIGDVIDVSGLLGQADALTDAINDFVFKTEADGNTTLFVDATGSGDIANATAVAVLEGVAGLSLEQITGTAQGAAV